MKIEYKTPATGPRDHEHRRVAESVNTTFSEQYDYFSGELKKIQDALATVGGDYTFNPMKVPGYPGGVGG